MGGMHAKLIPEEVAQHCDSVIVGDAEPVWAGMIADFQAGKLRSRYDAVQPLCPQEGIIARRDLFEGKGYLPISLLQFSRGCSHKCSFCASSVYFGARHFCRPVEEVLREIHSQKRKLLFFVDDNIVCNRAAAKALFRALIPLKIHWVSQGSMDMLQDRELMELMVESGCLGLVIGFESISPDCIQEMHKLTNTRASGEMYAKEIEQLRAWGLQTWAAFTVGHDGDTVESIRATCDFAIRNKFTFAAFNILMPYPNTPLYAKLKRENRLLYDGCWWLHEDYRFNYCSIVPKHMTPDELTEISFDCRRRFNSVGSIISRALEPRTNLRTPYRLMTYLLYNPLFRKEVFKKQGLHFGLQDGKGVHI